MSGYALSSGACIACTATATAGSAGCIACNATSGNTTCTSCASGYVLGANYCWPCNATTATTFGSLSWIGRLNCATCTYVATTVVAGVGAITGSYLTCTACTSGWTILTSTVNALISTPICVNITAGSLATTTTTDGNGALNTLTAGDLIIATATYASQCVTGSLTVPATTGPFVLAGCAQSTTGYWCGLLLATTF